MRNPIIITAAVAFAALATLQSPAKQIHADRTTSPPRDLAPGLRVAAAPYTTPAGCPFRQWSAGEYLPATCIVGHRIDPIAGEQIGLERPRLVGKTEGRRPWRSFRQREWVRVGGDALLLTRPKDAAGKILHVARGRFLGTAPELKPDGRDYLKPPMDHILRGAIDLLFVPISVFGVIGAILLYHRIRPPGRR